MSKDKKENKFKCPDGLDCSDCTGCFYALLCNPDFQEEYEEMRKCINGSDD